MGLFSRKKKPNQEKSKNQGESKLDEFTQQMSDAAEQCVARFQDQFQLDFSVKSLEFIDERLGEASDFYPEMEDGQRNGLIQTFGSYIFEVARRNYGGKYFWYDQGNQPILVTGQPKFEISLIVFDKVKGRLENGEEDNIPFFFAGYSERVENAKEGDRATIV